MKSVTKKIKCSWHVLITFLKIKLHGLFPSLDHKKYRKIKNHKKTPVLIFLLQINHEYDWKKLQK